MWMINFLPDAMVAFVIYTILAGGILLYFGSKLIRWLPQIRPYSLPMEFFGIICLIGAVYLIGIRVNEQVWQERVKEVEVKLKEAEEKSAQVNVVVQERVVTRTRVVKEKGDEIIRYVDREVVKLDENCKLPPEAVNIHNAAAKNELPAEKINQIIDQVDQKHPPEEINEAAKTVNQAARRTAQ
jgi:E3 ubiquitin-protein ligase DOA10